MGSTQRLPRVLSIAGSDSGGGAGIQADLKAFAACGVHGMTAITAVTAQNTVGVDAVHHVPGEMIVAQVAAVARDIGVDAVKIGMLGVTETIEAVAAALDLLDAEIPVVLDPVMVSESGGVLLDPSARTALIARLLPRATVVTPNVPEARAIVGTAPDAIVGTAPDAIVETAPDAAVDASDAGIERLAQRILALGPGAVVVTGGHRAAVTDVFVDRDRLVEIPGERFADGAAHGSGCTHSSALAARLAWGDDPVSAARSAKAIAGRAVALGLREIGGGAGPVDVLDIRHPRVAPRTEDAHAGHTSSTGQSQAGAVSSTAGRRP